MIQETLFGVEVGNKDYLEMTTLEKMESHNKRLEEKRKSNPVDKSGKRKATITLSEDFFSVDGNNGFNDFKKGDKFISVRFEGFNEGSSSPCINEEEANKHLRELVEEHQKKYNIKIIDERIKQKEYPSLELSQVEIDTANAREKPKPKKKEWEFKELGIQDETEFVTYVNFETENERGFEFFKTRKILRGFEKVKQIKKNEIERKLVCVVGITQDDLEGIINDYEEVFKTEQEIKDFIQQVKECDEFAIKKNKENIFFDTRRYFWKYENKELKNLGWNCLNEQEQQEEHLRLEKEQAERNLKAEQEKNSLENLIKKSSEELKELLKKKYGYPITIRVLKEVENVNAV